jgi:RNA polymerase sigma factor (sigma-70 family)
MWLKHENSQEDGFLEKAIRGDRAGLEYLVRTYKDLAYTIAIGIVSNNEDAEEVVQDSFLKAFRSLHTFRRASKFSTWLFRIVYNTALSKLKRKRIPTAGLDEKMNEAKVAMIESDEWDLLEQEERKKYIDLALTQLTTEDRLVITLHYIGEKSISEICEITGKEKSAIKMRLLRGRKQLESALGSLLNDEIKDLL